MAVNAPEACQRFEINARSVWTISATPMIHAQADAPMDSLSRPSGPETIATRIDAAAMIKSRMYTVLSMWSNVFLCMILILSVGREAVGKRAECFERQRFRARVQGNARTFKGG